MIRVLGSIDLLDAPGPADLRGRMQRALVATLVVHRPDPRSTTQLIDDLWPDGAPVAAAATLQAHISRVRQLLGERAIARSSAGYRLHADVDADLFADHIAAAAGANGPAETARRLRCALALWRGRPFGDIGDEEYVRPDVVRLTEMRGDAVESLFEAELAGGRRPLHLVAEIESAIDAYPYRERLWYQLMLALHRAERQAEALAAFTRARRLLGDELGIEPGQALRDLELRILHQDPALLRTRRP